MAIFLLIYVIAMLVWFAWSLGLTFLLIKHKLPDGYGRIHLIIYWALMGVIVLVSIIFIMRADWVTVPTLFKSATLQ